MIRDAAGNVTMDAKHAGALGRLLSQLGDDDHARLGLTDDESTRLLDVYAFLTPET